MEESDKNVDPEGVASDEPGGAPQGGDTHDTFKVEPEGSTTDGHKTIRIPSGQGIKLPW